MKEKEKQLLEIINDILWMAIRYAHGRHSYAPYIVRDAVKKLKNLYPDFKLKPDSTISPPTEEEIEKQGFIFRGDYLDDLFE